MRDWNISVGAIFKEVITKSVILSWVITSFVVALAGPFGTFVTQPFHWRLAYWAAVIAAAIVIAFTCRVTARTLLTDTPDWIEDALVLGTMSVIFGPAVVAFNTRLSPDAASVMTWPLATAITFLVGVGIVVVRRWMHEAPTAGPTKGTGARDRLLDRLDAGPEVRLVRVSSDNHHIRVTTDDGQEHRLLMRMRDAVAEIDVEPGFNVHRSHWIAVAQIEQIEQKNGKEVVRMPDGASVPVGPKYRTNLIESGVLAV